MQTHISKGLQLPAFDVEMMGTGKLIAVPFKQYVADGQMFWLYPSQQLPFNVRLEQYYLADYLEYARESFDRASKLPLEIEFCAASVYHWHIYPNQRHLLPILERSTIWNFNALDEILEKSEVLKLLFLRVFRLPEKVVINHAPKTGSYFWPHAEDQVKSQFDDLEPIVTNFNFDYRKKLLMEGKLYPYRGLENLKFQVDKSLAHSVSASALSRSIQNFLGWTSQSVVSLKRPDWMDTIEGLGNRSIHEDDGTSNYAAGTAFELVVRQSLEFLGFQVDYSHKGGAGGLDLFCSEPYPMIGECKSGKKIPNDTAVQLLNLGTIHLDNKEEFSRSAKLIIGPGISTDQLQKAAKVHSMAIINPRTLENLVKLHHQYPIDLFKLKDHLTDGQADDGVTKFISLTQDSIKLRSHIIQIVKRFLESSYDESADLSQIHAIYTFEQPPEPLKKEEMREILIELSSPLTGYLGRRKGEDGSDSFYFLRDLVVTEVM